MKLDVDAFDHLHLYVSDRSAAERWYAQVLGFTRCKEFECWAADGGPLTLRNAGDTVHLALFERAAVPGGAPNRAMLALRVDADGFVAWLAHLRATLGDAVTLGDHDLAVSMYFRDPDGNPFEITTYQHEKARQLCAPALA